MLRRKKKQGDEENAKITVFIIGDLISINPIQQLDIISTN